MNWSRGCSERKRVRQWGRRRAPPILRSILTSPKEKCVRVFLPRQPRISDNGISLFEGDPRQSRGGGDKKKRKKKNWLPSLWKAATAFSTYTLHVWAQFTLTLIHSDHPSFAFRFFCKQKKKKLKIFLQSSVAYVISATSLIHTDLRSGVSLFLATTTASMCTLGTGRRSERLASANTQ